MRNFLFLLLVSLGFAMFPHSLEAQGNLNAPGYLGKRASIAYNIFAFPGFGITPSAATYNGASNEERFNGDFFINFSQGISFDYVLSKVISIGFGVEYLRTGVHALFPYQIKAPGVGMQISFFPFKRKGVLAPLGPYSRLGFPKVFFLDVQGGDPSTIDFQEEGYRIRTFSVSVEFGYNFIVNDTWLPSIGLRYSLSGLNLGIVAAPNDYPPAVRSGAERLLGNDLIKLHLGLGYLF